MEQELLVFQTKWIEPAYSTRKRIERWTYLGAVRVRIKDMRVCFSPVVPYFDPPRLSPERHKR
jgi:hypothetical protein